MKPEPLVPTSGDWTAPSRPPAAVSRFPTRDDPAIVLGPRQGWLVCWVEHIDGQYRWHASTGDGITKAGPPFRGEDSLERIRDAFAAWSTTLPGDRD